MTIGTFSCPSCGASGKSFGAVKSFMRRPATRCANCDAYIFSDISYGKYLSLLVYIHVILVLTAVPFVLALAGGRLLVAGGSMAIFALLTIPPAMLLQSRNVKAGQR